MIFIRRFFIGLLFLIFSTSAHAFFPEGTPIIFKGKATPIETVHKGQYVLGLDTKTGKRWTYPVTQTLTATAKELVVLTVGKETIETTPEQPFLTERGNWVEARKLKPGDRLVGDKGKLVAVRKVERNQEEKKIYHFEVGEVHTFFVGLARVLAHNAFENNSIVRVDDEGYAHYYLEATTAEGGDDIAVAKTRYDSETNIFHLVQIDTDDQWKRRGAATRLMTFLFEEARKHGYHKMQLTNLSEPPTAGDKLYYELPRSLGHRVTSHRSGLGERVNILLKGDQLNPHMAGDGAKINKMEFVQREHLLVQHVMFD